MIGASYAVALLLLTLGPLGWWLNRLTVRIYGWWRYDLGNIDSPLLPEHVGLALNVALFVPAGVVLTILLSRRWWAAGLLAVMSSAAIELVQLLPVIAREASLGDVIANGSGAAIGVGLVALQDRLVRRRRTDSS